MVVMSLDFVLPHNTAIKPLQDNVATFILSYRYSKVEIK